MSWFLEQWEKVKDGAGELVDGYVEREVEATKPEPANTANMPKQSETASVIKYDDTAAAIAAQQQAERAAAAAKPAGFMTKYGKWLAIGGGTVAAVGAFALLSKGGKR